MLGDRVKFAVGQTRNWFISLDYTRQIGEQCRQSVDSVKPGVARIYRTVWPTCRRLADNAEQTRAAQTTIG